MLAGCLRAPAGRRSALPHACENGLMCMEQLGEANTRRLQVAEKEQQPEQMVAPCDYIDADGNLHHLMVMLVKVIPERRMGGARVWQRMARAASGAATSPNDGLAQPRPALATHGLRIELGQDVVTRKSDRRIREQTKRG